MTGSSADQGAENWAIAIVHGIGTPEPGQTRDAVCAGIRLIKPDFSPVESPDKPGSGEQGLPPIHDWTFGRGRAKVAEIFWGDLSLVRGTVGDMIRAICINLYGAVYVNSRTLQTTSKFTKFLPIVPFYLVRWIVLPLHVLAVCLAVPVFLRYRGENVAGANGYLTTNDEFFLGTAAACVLVGLALTIWLILRQRSSIRPQPWDMTLIFAGFAALSALFADRALAGWFNASSAFGSWLRDHSVAAWFETCVDRHRAVERGFGKIVSEGLQRGFDVSRDACHLIIANTPIEKVEVSGVGRYVAVNEFVGDVAFYASAGMVLLYLLIAAAYAVFGRRDIARPMFFVATISLLFVVATAILLEVFDLVTRYVQFGGTSEFFAYWYELGFVAWLAIVAIGAGISFAWRKKLSRSYAAADRRGDHKTAAEVAYARLIVSETFQFAVILATVVFILVLLANEMIPSGYRDYKVSAGWKLLAPVVAALLLAIVIYFKELRLGLDVAMDVVNHFVAPGRGFPIRRTISERFQTILNSLIDAAKGSGKPHLLVIAHSQGSVIVADALVKDLWNTPLKEGAAALKDRVSGMTVLTFGSPLTHIYQHYFPSDYGALAATPLRQLADDPRVKWLNIYRIDDPVGTTISGPNENFPKNVRLPVGGHFRYWEQDALSEQAISRLLPGN